MHAGVDIRHGSATTPAEFTARRDNGRRRPRGYADWAPQAATRALLDDVDDVLDRYRDHLPLTIRQVFYALVGVLAQDGLTVLLHVGDLDPSGESIFAAIAQDAAAFVVADRTLQTTRLEAVRVALTREQVDEFSLPTAPAKASDSRARLDWRHLPARGATARRPRDDRQRRDRGAPRP